MGEGGIVVGWGTMLQAGRSRHQIQMKWSFKKITSASNRNDYQGMFLKEYSWGAKKRSARRADNLAAIY
jgi:hypothetical protein